MINRRSLQAPPLPVARVITVRQRQDGPEPENRARDPAVKIMLDSGSHINFGIQPSAAVAAAADAGR